MYEDYYGFTEKPFSLTPDPKYLFKSASHANAFDLLQYAVRRREGFVVITGDIGTGKTTMCRALLEQLDRKIFSALVLNPFLSEEDLLRLILQDFGIVSREEMRRGRLAGISKQELIETLNDFLLSLQPLGARALLIIDEAQNLPLQVLEQIRILSNLETDKEKLLQIVLVGQPSLKGLLRSMELRQLEQRVSIKYELQPLTPEESGAYVMHRLAIGGGGAVSFAPATLLRIHRYTNGIPRLINLVCDRALLAAYSSRANRVLPAHVRHAAETLDLALPRRRVSSWVRQRIASFAAGVGVAMAFGLASGSYSQPSPAPLPAVRHFNARPAPIREPIRVERPFTFAPAVRPAAPIASATPAIGQRGQAPAATGTNGSDRGAAVARPTADTARPYSVLVASFRMASEADTLASQLRDLGYQTSVSRAEAPRGLWHLVLAGPFNDLGVARQSEARLRQLPGYSDAHLVQQ